MKAAVLWEVGQPLSLEEVELDPPKADEVHVKVGAAGICRSDLHVMHGHATARLPAVLGHEGAGTVVDVGEGVTSVKPGDPRYPFLCPQLWTLLLLPLRKGQPMRCSCRHRRLPL